MSASEGQGGLKSPSYTHLYLDDIPVLVKTSSSNLKGFNHQRSPPGESDVKEFRMRPAIAAAIKLVPDPLNMRCDFCGIYDARHKQQALDGTILLLCSRCNQCLMERK